MIIPTAVYILTSKRNRGGIHSSPNLEITSMITNRRDEEIVVFLYNKIPISNKMEGAIIPGNNLSKSYQHEVELKRLDTKKYIL